VGAHDNFFELGGYSLLCFQVLERIERETGQRLNPRLLLLDSLRQVAARLDEAVLAAAAAPPKRTRTVDTQFLFRLSKFLPGLAYTLLEAAF
jgi:hypothetical protein